MNTLSLVMNEVSPCDNCGYSDSCKNKKLACLAFVSYVVSGRFNIKFRKNPDNIIYSKVFEDGLSRVELRELKSSLKNKRIST